MIMIITFILITISWCICYQPTQNKIRYGQFEVTPVQKSIFELGFSRALNPTSKSNITSNNFDGEARIFFNKGFNAGTKFKQKMNNPNPIISDLKEFFEGN